MINFSESDKSIHQEILLKTEKSFHFPVEAWDQITNTFTEPCHIIEIQYSEKINEDDFERLRYYEANDKV